MNQNVNPILGMFKKVERPSAPKIILYGPPGCGKTKAAAAFGGLHMDIEGSAAQYPGMVVAPSSMFPDYPAIRSTLQQLAQHGTGEHRVLTIDTLDWLINKGVEYILSMDGKKEGDAAITNTTMTAFGGYGKAREMIERLVSKEIIPPLMKINERGVVILMLAHAAHLKGKDAEGMPNAVAAPKIDPKALAVLAEWSDMILYMRQDETPDGIARQIVTTDTSRFMAKNRLDLAPVIAYDKPEDIKRIIYAAIKAKTTPTEPTPAVAG